MRKGFSLPVLVSCILSGIAFGQDRVGRALLSQAMSVRQAGMGEVSVGGDDVLRGWVNPAILAMQDSKWELAAGGTSLFGEQTGLGLGVGFALNPSWTFGGYLASSGIEGDVINVIGEKTGEKISHSSMAGGVAASRKYKYFTLGGMLGGVSESVAKDSGSTICIGLGATASYREFGLGVSFRNKGLTTYMKAGKEGSQVPIELPTELRVGASYLYSTIGLSFGAEYVSVLSMDSTIGAGCEWWYHRILALRTGLMKNLADTTGAINLSVGLSVLYRELALDYALSTHEIGLSNRVAISYAFGSKRADLAKEAPISTAKAISLIDTEVKPEATDTADRLYQEAITAHGAGEYRTAIERAEAAVTINPKMWQAWQVDGNARIALGDRKGALIVYKYALGIEPNNPALSTYVVQLEQSLEQ